MLDDMTVAPLLAAACCAIATAVAWPLLCRAAAEPAGVDGNPPTGRVDTEAKRRYATLATSTWTTTLAATAAVAGGVLTASQPCSTWAVGILFATVGLWQAAFDAATTYIPRRLAHATWLLLFAALAVTAVHAPASALTQATGALTGWAVFAAVWRVSGGFGYADVRFAPLLGAAGAAVSGLGGVFLVIAAGCLMTAVVMVVDRRRTGLQRMVPWVPGLWLAVLLATPLP